MLNRLSIFLIQTNINKRTYFYNFTTLKRLNQILQNIKITDQNNNLTNNNILQSGIIVDKNIDQKTSKVTLLLNLTKDYRKIKEILKIKLIQEGFKQVDINLAPKQSALKFQRKGNLLNIKKIIAVSSCKGGVGKSTIAVNMAATMANLGYKVGIFDSDIYGPSLPTLINRQQQTLQPREQNPKEIQPIIYEGIKCMSFGFIGSKPAIMRGPIVSSIVSQLLYQTYWGQLDYLFVDMPPGTGDIQLSLCQQLKFNGAMIVTTPQKLAFMDVIKGIQMFVELKVRILGVVENMAYYECGKCGIKDLIFGKGYTKMLKQQFGIQNAVQFPLMGDVSKYCDAGTPLAMVLPSTHALVKLYQSLCECTVRQVEKQLPKIMVYYSTNDRKVTIQQNENKHTIDPYLLRCKCRCASCIDQLSGSMLIRKQDIDPGVYPTKIEEKGNYAVGVVWSDGHRSSIYTYQMLMKL